MPGYDPFSSLTRSVHRFTQGMPGVVGALVWRAPDGQQWIAPLGAPPPDRHAMPPAWRPMSIHPRPGDLA